MTEDTKNEGPQGTINPEKVEEVKKLVQSLWNGEIQLVRTFWLYYFVAVFVINLLGHIIAPLAGLFALLAIAWGGFMIMPVIRAADRYEGEKLWAMAAKVAVVLSFVLNLLSLR